MYHPDIVISFPRTQMMGIPSDAGRINLINPIFDHGTEKTAFSEKAALLWPECECESESLLWHIMAHPKIYWWAGPKAQSHLGHFSLGWDSAALVQRTPRLLGGYDSEASGVNSTMIFRGQTEDLPSENEDWTNDMGILTNKKWTLKQQTCSATSEDVKIWAFILVGTQWTSAFQPRHRDTYVQT